MIKVLLVCNTCFACFVLIVSQKLVHKLFLLSFVKFLGGSAIIMRYVRACRCVCVPPVGE